MNFNSYEFVLCYLPIVVILWYQLNKLAGSRYAKLMLVVASLIFQGTDFNLKNLILPLGISFYTFQQIGFLADCYRGEVKELSFLDYCLFVTFFPQLVAGPIVEYNEMLPQFNDAGKKHVKRNRTWV